MSLKHKVLDSIKWLVLAQIFTQIFRLVVTAFVIRQISSADMALVALAQTTIGFLEMFSVLGLNAAIISKPNIDKKDINAIFGLIMLINILLAALLLLLSVYLAGFYDEPRLVTLFRVLSLSFILSAVGTVFGSVLTKEMRFRELSMVHVGSGIAGACASFYSITLGLSYWAIVIGGLVNIGARSAMNIIILKEFYFPSFSFKRSLEHISFGGPVMGAGIAWYIYVSMDIIIAGKLWSAEMVGVYAVAVQLTVMPLNRFMPLIKSVALPAFSKTYASDKSKVEDYMAKSLRIVMFITFPAFFGIAAVALELIPLVLGEKWADVSVPLALLCISAPFRSLLELHAPAVVATGNTTSLFKNTFTVMVVMLISFYMVIRMTSSPASLALVWTIVFPILAINSSRNYCRVMNISFPRIIQQIYKPLLASAIMAIAVFYYSSVLSSAMHGTILLISSIVVGMLIYFILIFIIDRPLAVELRGLMSRSAK